MTLLRWMSPCLIDAQVARVGVAWAEQPRTVSL